MDEQCLLCFGYVLSLQPLSYISNYWYSSHLRNRKGTSQDAELDAPSMDKDVISAKTPGVEFVIENVNL